MKKAYAFLFLVVTLFCYGHAIKQSDHRNVRKPSSARHIVKNDRQLERARETREISQFLSGSPLQDEAQAFVDASYTYGLDYRLLPAISGTESTFGKFTPSCAQYNPFGWTSTTSPCGFYRFQSYNEAIWTVAQKLALNPAYAGFRQAGGVSVLAETYNPGGVDHWVASTNYFMESMKGGGK